MSNKSIEQRIKEACESLAYSYETPSHRNCYGCCQSDYDYEKCFTSGFKAGVDFGREIEREKLTKYNKLEAENEQLKTALKERDLEYRHLELIREDYFKKIQELKAVK